MSNAAGLGALVRPASQCCSAWLQGPEVFGEQGLFGGQDRGAAEQLDAFAMAPGVEGPGLAPLASDPGLDWVRTYCRRPALCVEFLYHVVHTQQNRPWYHELCSASAWLDCKLIGYIAFAVSR